MDASWRMDAVRRQLEELEAVRATWPEEGAVVLCREEEDALDQLRRTVDGGGVDVGDGSEGSATVSYAVAPPNVPGVVLQVSLPRSYPFQGRPTIRADVQHATRERTAMVQRTIDACLSQLEGCECVHAAVSAAQEAMEDVDVRLDPSRPVPRASEGSDATCSIRALWFHHVYARGKRKAMATWARELRLRGWCLVGRPGALVVFGRRGDAATFVQNVKGLRWQAVAERYVEDDVDPARGVDVSHLPRGGWEEIDGERGFAQLVERCRDAGLERVVHALIRKDT